MIFFRRLVEHQANPYFSASLNGHNNEMTPTSFIIDNTNDKLPSRTTSTPTTVTTTNDDNIHARKGECMLKSVSTEGKPWLAMETQVPINSLTTALRRNLDSSLILGGLSPTGCAALKGLLVTSASYGMGRTNVPSKPHFLFFSQPWCQRTERCPGSIVIVFAN